MKKYFISVNLLGDGIKAFDDEEALKEAKHKVVLGFYTLKIDYVEDVKEWQLNNISVRFAIDFFILNRYLLTTIYLYSAINV